MGVQGRMDQNDLAAPRPFGMNSATVRINRAADAFDAVAWRAPSYPRGGHVPANDETTSPTAPMPSWLIPAAGALAAAIMGAMLGGALAL